MAARRGLLHLITKLDGKKVALERAFRRIQEKPGHDGLEQLYCECLDEAGSPKKERVRRSSSASKT